jgi:hypothetical protein
VPLRQYFGFHCRHFPEDTYLEIFHPCAKNGASLVATGKKINGNSLGEQSTPFSLSRFHWSDFYEHSYHALATNGASLVSVGPSLRAPGEQSHISSVSRLPLEKFP